MSTHTFEIEIDGRPLRIETGRLAAQAGGAVTVTFGETVVLATVVASKNVREGIDFFPLTVDFEERMYAAGRVPGSFFRREGRPSSEATLTARLIDRPLRPLFPEGFRNEVQVIVTALSVDMENDPDVAAIVGASAALSISDIPFNGPVAGVRIGRIDGRFTVNPTFAQRAESDLDLVVAGTSDAIMMVEAGAEQVDEAALLEGLRIAQGAIRDIVALQERMAQELGKPKREFTLMEPDAEVALAVRTFLGDRLEQAIRGAGDKTARYTAIDTFHDETVGHFTGQHDAGEVARAYDNELSRVVRGAILDAGQRPDGRALKEIRPITVDVGILPRTHGSGLFTRGETQVLTLATLGTKGDAQKLDNLSPIKLRRYIHHYNFPPYSTGETGRVGSPRRREIGHGALAERALLPVIPAEEEFPYTIRLVSEVLSSNGSSSMASVCGSTLALMDAGVPITAPVAGVAMGLILDPNGRYQVLTDIAGMEDHLGDMDFKVAGTERGITALQMDIKVKGITLEIMQQALAQAYEGRIFILGRMTETINRPRAELSPHAPRMYRISIDPEKIGAVIGPGGRVVRAIVEETGCSIDIQDDGSIFIGATNEEAARKAIGRIEGLTKEVEVGTVYTGKVVRIMTFGAFVEILPGKDGLVHISELAQERVNTVEDVVKVGDEITVMVTEIDAMGRINLSRRAILEGAQPDEVISAAAQRRPEGPGGPGRGGPGGGRGGFDRGPQRNGDGGPRGGFDRGGPPSAGRPRPTRGDLRR